MMHPEFIAGLRYHLDQFVATAREGLTEDGATPDEVTELLFNHFVDPGFLQPNSTPLSPEFHTHVLATLIALSVVELARPPLPPITL